jgi:hypothetical protein
MPLTSAPTALLEEIAATRDSQRSGAIDVDWNGVRASIYFVFGQPSHATFAGLEGEETVGNAALDRLLAEVPDGAAVNSWRRVMIPEDTLRCSIDELYARCAERTAGPAAADASPPSRPVVPFRVGDFPILPLGTSLWSDAAANIVHLDLLAPQLPDSLIVLTAPGCRAVAVVAHGAIVDAVWVSDSVGLVGGDAARALMSTGEGTVSGYGLDDDRLLMSLPLLWRAPRSIAGLHAEWLDTDRLLADFRAEGRSCALLVSGAAEGVALVDEGTLVATYTQHRRRPSSSASTLRTLLRTPGARVAIATRGPDQPAEAVLDEDVIQAPPPAEAAVAAVPAPVMTDVAAAEPAAVPAVAAPAEDGVIAVEADAPAVADGPDPDATPSDIRDEVDADVPTFTLPLSGDGLDVGGGSAAGHTSGPGTDDHAAANGHGIDAVSNGNGRGNGAASGDHPGGAGKRGKGGRIGRLRGLKNGRGNPGVAEPPPLANFPPDVFALPEFAPSAPPHPPQPTAEERDVAASDVEPPPAPAVDAPPDEPVADAVPEATAPAVTPDDEAHADPHTDPAPDDEPVVAAPSLALASEPAAAAAEPLVGEDEPRPAAPTQTDLDDHDHVTPRLDFDVDALRTELVTIATAWLGPDDIAPIAGLINAARPGVDEFVGTIAAISALPVPGHESAVVRAMAREMHFRAAEVLCGV